MNDLKNEVVSTQQVEIKPWWGGFSMPQNQTGYWQIGPLNLYIRRVRQEWHVASECLRDVLDRTLDVSFNAEFPNRPDLVFSRFAFRETTKNLSILPQLSDRAVVIRPEAPLYIPAGEEVTLFVSLPVWIRIEAGNPAKFLQELPIYRPSDTWFGPSTREGDLCYASRTSARLNVNDVPFRPHRAVASVVIRNAAEDPLFVERLNVTAQHLSLFATPDGYLWTQGMILEREEDGEAVQVHFEKTAPAVAKDAVLLSGPRIDSEDNLLTRAFHNFFA